MKKNIIAGQSGGPTAVINASLYGVIEEGLSRAGEVGTIYGMINGIEGFLSGHFMDLSAALSPEDRELLKHTPGAYLGSCRHKLPQNMDSPVYPLLFEKLASMDIGALFYIGGNDSMDTVEKLSRYGELCHSSISFIGVPKTIDNDLPVTDHTPGYGSAAKYVASTVREIVLDASVYQQPSITLVELMGRHAGWVTAASVLARKFPEDNPRLIYLPESPFSVEQLFADVERALAQTPSLVICVSEGIKDSSGRFICEYASEAQTDTFGHKMLTGCAKILEGYLKNRFGVKVRSVELNVNQRCSGLISSLCDIEEAAEAGRFAVKSALEGASGQMVTLNRLPGPDYHMVPGLTDAAAVCNKEKTFPSEWITPDGCGIRPEFISYALPLIQGEPPRRTKDGLPCYLYRNV
ncbi:MAG TPA: 6-phosphofructokinase [Candidatus Enterocloster excrementipullorum]|mgnify:FL=1|uniref:Pyrophosphate--fructose 6-phosphate 1-phosphotransferase n=1 Tax=Candidatus Enterocloster excrementipullorum TaxID=2838559 RepID=A0A9D2MYD0_9FIRM|nr:6-phosphofructokinase [Candidatus Enterocloster excrementipullorum]